jgi:transcriptional regulator with XRE-family HTH domain
MDGDQRRPRIQMTFLMGCVPKRLYADTVTAMSDIAILVRDAREGAGLSMRALAERSDVSFTTISRIENSQIDPTFATVQKLFTALGQTLHLSCRRSKPVPHLADLADAWSADATGHDQPDWTTLRAFIDYLFRHPEDAQASILAAPAPSGSPLLDNLIAGVAEKIADDNGLRRPSWTKRVLALSAPWEGMGTARMRSVARLTTPSQFESRNVFIAAETIWRKRNHAVVR